MIDTWTLNVTKRNPKVECRREFWCAPGRGKTLPACLPGRVSCTIKLLRENSPDGILILVFALYVDAFDNEVLLSYWLAEVCFFPFVFFCSFDYFRSIVVVNCVVVFTFSQTAHNNQRILFYVFCLTLVDLIIHYKYINRNIHLICTVVVSRTVNSTIPEEKNMCNKQKLRMNSLHLYYVPYYAIYFDFTFCNTQIDTAK